jgi:hypothetical protein
MRRGGVEATEAGALVSFGSEEEGSEAGSVIVYFRLIILYDGHETKTPTTVVVDVKDDRGGASKGYSTVQKVTTPHKN